MSRRSTVYVICAMVIYVADWVSSAVITSNMGISFGFLGTIGILARGLLLVPLVQALGATRLLQQKR